MNDAEEVINFEPQNQIGARDGAPRTLGLIQRMAGWKIHAPLLIDHSSAGQFREFH